MDQILQYFTRGTERTLTEGAFGMEIETDFLTDDGKPISEAVSQYLLNLSKGKPKGCDLKLELARQKLELSFQPQRSANLMFESVYEGTQWLYRKAAEKGAYPYFAPEVMWNEPLLWVQEERDEVWVQLDGRPALEHLCRCSSVQFTVDVNPYDAVYILNKLWKSRLHERDYVPNNNKWIQYMNSSVANYLPDRYGGPCGFENMQDYVNQLTKHDVVMHKGKPIRKNVEYVADLNIDLFLRSVWWHYRLRRYGSTLAIEMRPFARRHDDDFQKLWKEIARVIGV